MYIAIDIVRINDTKEFSIFNNQKRSVLLHALTNQFKRIRSIIENEINTNIRPRLGSKTNFIYAFYKHAIPPGFTVSIND